MSAGKIIDLTNILLSCEALGDKNTLLLGTPWRDCFLPASSSESSGDACSCPYAVPGGEGKNTQELYLKLPSLLMSVMLFASRVLLS